MAAARGEEMELKQAGNTLSSLWCDAINRINSRLMSSSARSSGPRQTNGWDGRTDGVEFQKLIHFPNDPSVAQNSIDILWDFARNDGVEMSSNKQQEGCE